MKLRWHCKTGWPSNQTELAARVSAFGRADRVSAWKVGITNAPQVRERQYVRAGLHYDEMIVLYRSSSREHVLSMESEIIHGWRDTLDNANAGWGGPRPAGPHYVYLVVRRR